MTHLKGQGPHRRMLGVAATAVAAILLLAGCTTDSAGSGSTVAADDLGFLTQDQYDTIMAAAKRARARRSEEGCTCRYGHRFTLL